MTSQRESANEQLLRRREAAVPRGPFNAAPIFVDRALGAEVWDVDGKRYVDFAGGIGTLNVGHNHPRVVEAIRSQAERLIHACWHVAMYSPYVELAERLNAIVPIGGACRTALFNSGAEAVENAVKIARTATKRTAVVAFERGFHGRTLLGMSLTGKVRPYSFGFGPFAPEVYRLPCVPFFDPPDNWSDERVAQEVSVAIEALFHYHVDASEIACVVMEPILGEGGFFPAHPSAIRTLRRICAENGILFIADEVQSGFGRCGAMFACERYGIEPDLVTMAKSLAAGMPLSAVTGRAELMDVPEVGGIGGTYGGNPVACAAANAVLDIFESEDLTERANAIGATTMAILSGLTERHDFVARARGLGAMCAIEICDGESGAPDSARTAAIIARARERGLLLISASGNVIRTLMPLVIPDELLEEGLDILDAAVADAAVEGEVAVGRRTIDDERDVSSRDA
jgi:4-aminobutyrate aminotransferase/(S)-3-amino-2-methylpropionate transaminase